MAYEDAAILTEQQYVDLHHGGTDAFSNVKIDVGQDLTTVLGDLTAQGHVSRALSTVSYDKEIIAPPRGWEHLLEKEEEEKSSFESQAERTN